MPEAATVTIDEVAARLGGGSTITSTIAWADRVGVTPAVDWAGRLALTPKDAARLVDEFDRTTAENDIAWHAYQQHLRDRDVAARTAGDEAFHRAVATHRGEGRGDPECHAAGVAAQVAAHQKYYKAHPEPTFEQFKKKGPKP